MLRQSEILPSGARGRRAPRVPREGSGGDLTRSDIIPIVYAAMDRKGLTQAATAEAAGMTAANLSDWLRGVSDIRADALLRLFMVLGIRLRKS